MLSTAAVPAAQNVGTATAPEVLAASADLNGDGRPEKITVSFAGQNPLQLTLAVNGVKLADKSGEFAEESAGFRIVKIDSTGKTCQIAVRLTGVGDREETRFYRWDGRAIRRVGLVPSAMDVSGNGAIYAGVWMGFWRCSQKFSLDPKTQVLAFVRQPAYHVGVAATVKQSFPIHLDHAKGSAAVAGVAPGSKIQLLLFWSAAARPEAATEPSSWYLIKTATGLCGWARFDSFREKVEGLPYAG